MGRFRITNPLFAIAGGQFALSIMQIVFMFYYVKVYLNVFHVSSWWFNFAQALFMVWNAINDPLFGYLQDAHHGWMRSRVKVIKRFAPFLCLSFVFMWFPWDANGSWLEGVHLILSLFFYDAFFSAIGVAWSALFADSTKDAHLRVSAMKYSQISILMSVNAIAILEKASHSLENISAFQSICVIFAIISFIGLSLAGSLQEGLPFINNDDSSSSLLAYNSDDDGDLNTDTTSSKNSHYENATGLSHALQLMQETVKEKDFLVIIATNFIHIMRSVAHMNFASITTEILVPQTILPKGSLLLSGFYALCTLGPQLLIIFSERLVVRLGASRVLLFSYFASVLSAASMYWFCENPYAVILFMVIDSITVHSAAPLFNIIISDYIDEDCKRHNRKKAISSFVFSLNALFTKPAQSVAPVLVVYLLNFYGYQNYLTDKVANSNLVMAVQGVLYATPLILGGCQLLIFKYYSLIKKPTKQIVV